MSDPVFFEPPSPRTLAEVAALTGAELADPATADRTVSTIGSAADGGAGALVYVEGKRNAHFMPRLRATAVFCTADLAPQASAGVAVLLARRPQQAYALVGRLLFPAAASPVAMTGETGISPAAHVDPRARLEPGAIVEAGAVICAGAVIGEGTIVAPNAVIGPNCQVGRRCYIGPGAVVQHALIGNAVIVHAGAKIGQDGFGFVPGRNGPERIPQIGRVVIQDNVEIGANSAIDRGAIADTVIGENTKIDNLVQIAHNVRIGRNCIIAGRSGIAGSSTLGDNVMLGGGAGLADHVTMADGAQLAAGSGLMHDVPAGEVWAGVPAKPMQQTFREIAMLTRLTRRKDRKGTADG